MTAYLKSACAVAALVVLLILGACGGDEPAAVEQPAAGDAAAVDVSEAESTPADAAAATTDGDTTPEAEGAATEAEEADAAEGEAVATEEAAAEEATADDAAAGDAASDASSPSTASVVSARPVTAIVDEREAPLAAVSPDGAHLAWIQRSGSGRQAEGQLCLFTFANADKRCHAAPEEFSSYPYQLFWAPKSNAIAFTENPIQMGLDSDIWLFTLDDAAFTNRTDDGVTGSWQAAESDFALDLAPMWSPAGDEIYFWRVVPLGNLEYTLGIFKVGVSDGYAEEVRDLTNALPGILPTFDQNTLTMDGMSALAQDGTTVAAILSNVAADPYTATPRSLWQIDLADGEAEPQQLMTPEDFQSALPAWQTLPADPSGLSWTSDGSSLVVSAFSNDSHAPLNLYYFVDSTSGDFMPVVDFSGVESMNALFAMEEGEIPLRYYAPWSASLDADGTSLIMYNDLGGTAGIMQAALPPDGSLPTLLGTAESPSLLNNGTRTSRSADGKVVLSNNMFTFE